VRALPSTDELDRTLAVRLRGGDRTLFDGRLGELRSFTRRPLVLPGGASARLVLDARLPAGATGWEGRIEDVVLDLRSEPLR
jgi:hypothetical protein